MKKKIKDFIFNENRYIDQNAIFWNMVFSIMSALQSAIMIMLVTRVIGTEKAGILSISYASAYLMFTIGVYGVRNFQVTDSSMMYSYNDYKKVRFLSCGMMIICSVMYCFFKNYEGDKVSVLLLVCILKLEESFEDLYHGELQRMGRLDIAGRLGTFRLGISYCIFSFVLFLSKNLIRALIYFDIFSGIIIFLTKVLLKDIIVKENNRGDIISLLITCFPLFVMSFLGIYISNAPKYAIDNYLSEETQAYYGIISMPLFVINLLSGVVYRPKLLYMAKLWNSNNKKKFIQLVRKQINNILLISILIIEGGLKIGLKILEAVYGISLGTLKREFGILLIGGGIVALYNFLTACLTIVRKQSFVLIISIIVMVLASIISKPIVQHIGLLGAAYLYLILMFTEMISVFLILAIYLYKKN